MGRRNETNRLAFKKKVDDKKEKEKKSQEARKEKQVIVRKKKMSEDAIRSKMLRGSWEPGDLINH